MGAAATSLARCFCSSSDAEKAVLSSLTCSNNLYTVDIAVYAIKHVSGGHVNPVVSLATAASGHIDWTRGVLYIAMQVRSQISSL